MSNNLTKTQIVGAPIYIGDFSKDSVANFEAQYNGKLSWEKNDIQPGDGKEFENPKRARTMTFIPFDSEYYINAENGVRFTVFFYIKKDSNNDNDSFENYSYRGHSDSFTDSVDFYDHVGEKITHFRIAAKTSPERDITNINLDIGENIKLYKRVERNSLEWKNEGSNVVTKDYLSFDPNLMVKYSGSEQVKVEVTFFQKTPNGYGEINPGSPKELLNGSFDFIDYDNIKTATHYKITIKNTSDIIDGNNIKIYEKVHGIKKEVDKIKKIVEDQVDRRYYNWGFQQEENGSIIHTIIDRDTGIEIEDEEGVYYTTRTAIPFDPNISITLEEGFYIYFYTFEGQTKKLLYQEELTKIVNPINEPRKSINLRNYEYLKDYGVSHFKLVAPAEKIGYVKILSTELDLKKQLDTLKEQNDKNLQLIKKINAQLNGNYIQNQLFYNWKKGRLFFTESKIEGQNVITNIEEEYSNYYICTDYIPFNNHICLTVTDFREVQLFFYEKKKLSDAAVGYENSFSPIVPAFLNNKGNNINGGIDVDESYSSYKNLNDFLTSYEGNSLLYFRICARHAYKDDENKIHLSKIENTDAISRYIKINERIEESEIEWSYGGINSDLGQEVENPYRTRSSYIPFDPTLTVAATNDRRLLIFFYKQVSCEGAGNYEYEYCKMPVLYFVEKINLSDYKFMLDQGATHFRIVLKHDDMYLKDAVSSSRYVFIYSNELGISKDLDLLKADNPIEIPMLPENKNVENALKKAKQIANLPYVTQARLPLQTIEIDGKEGPDGKKSDGKMASGAILKGVVYSSAKLYDKMVGQNVSLHTYMTAMKNPESVVYTRDLRDYSKTYTFKHNGKVITQVIEQGNCATYYGAVCSSFVGYCYDLPCNVVTNQLANWGKWASNGTVGQYIIETPLMEKLENKNDIKPGDFLLQSGHVRLITGVTRNKKGTITSVEVTEAKTPCVVATALQPGQYNALFSGSNPYVPYRYTNLYAENENGEVENWNSYEPIPYFSFPDENLELARYSDIISEFGDNAMVNITDLDGGEVKFKVFNNNNNNYNYLFINGVHQKEAKIGEVFSLTLKAGKWEITIASDENLNAEEIKKASTTITIIEPKTTFTRSNEQSPILTITPKIDDELYSPYYFALADQFGANLFSIPLKDIGYSNDAFSVDVEYFQNQANEIYNKIKNSDGTSSYYQEFIYDENEEKTVLNENYSKICSIKVYYQIKGSKIVVADTNYLY